MGSRNVSGKASEIILRWMLIWAPKETEDEVILSIETIFDRISKEEGNSAAQSWLVAQAVKAPFVSIAHALRGFCEGILHILEAAGSAFERITQLIWALIMLLMIAGFIWPWS